MKKNICLYLSIGVQALLGLSLHAMDESLSATISPESKSTFVTGRSVTRSRRFDARQKDFVTPRSKSRAEALDSRRETVIRDDANPRQQRMTVAQIFAQAAEETKAGQPIEKKIPATVVVHVSKSPTARPDLSSSKEDSKENRLVQVIIHNRRPAAPTAVDSTPIRGGNTRAPRAMLTYKPKPRGRAFHPIIPNAATISVEDQRTELIAIAKKVLQNEGYFHKEAAGKQKKSLKAFIKQAHSADDRLPEELLEYMKDYSLVFLERYDTIENDEGYVDLPDSFELLEGNRELLTKLLDIEEDHYTSKERTIPSFLKNFILSTASIVADAERFVLAETVTAAAERKQNSPVVHICDLRSLRA